MQRKRCMGSVLRVTPSVRGQRPIRGVSFYVSPLSLKNQSIEIFKGFESYVQTSHADDTLGHPNSVVETSDYRGTIP